MKITLGGIDVELMGEAVALVPSLATLCVSDLHFEKGSFFSQFSTFLPPYDTDDTLTRLEQVIDKYKPRSVITLGDSFHDLRAAERLPSDLVERLKSLIAKVSDWHWITGNHDPEIAAYIPGHRHTELVSQNVAFRHILSTKPNGPEFSGHYHPKTTVLRYGHSIRGPCFVQYGSQLILPSFGKFTGGLDIDSSAFTQKISASRRKVFLVHGHEIFAV